MNDREKRLLIGFVAVVVIAVGVQYGYPWLIKPLFDYGSELAEAKTERDELTEERDDLEYALQQQYRAYVLRSGGVDPETLKDELYESLAELVRRAKLANFDYKPKPIDEDRKSKVATLKVAMGAQGSFAQCVSFVRTLYDIPYVTRLNNLKLSPVSGRRRGDTKLVKLDAEIEAKLLPPSEFWDLPTGTPPPVPTRVASKNINTLRQWQPFERYNPPATPPPTPTPTPGPTTSPTPRPTPEPRGPDYWPDADEYMLKMVVRYGSGEYRVEEALLENVMNFSNRYIAEGEDFDGGELVVLNALGVVAHKADGDQDFGYWVYPLGELLNARIPLEDAAREWPELYVATQRYLQSAQGASLASNGSGLVGPERPAELADTDALLLEAAKNLFGDPDEQIMGPPLPPRSADTNGVTDSDIGSNATSTAGDDVEQPGAQPMVRPPMPRPTSTPASMRGNGPSADSPRRPGETRVRTKDRSSGRKNIPGRAGRRTGKPVKAKSPGSDKTNEDSQSRSREEIDDVVPPE
jgi:hypothetical protein